MDDLISRQAVDKIIKKYRDEQAARLSERCLERAYGANTVGMLISDLPSVTPQQKTGHWIEGRTNNSKIHNILCSCCFEGYPSRGHANSQHTRERFKYCPNCGAKMVEPQESEDK